MEGKVGQVLASVECPVCLEKYNDPRSLPCGHSFCRGCLQPLQYRSNVRCPTCRNETCVNSVSDLPKPYALLDVMRVLENVSLNVSSSQSVQKLPSAATTITSNSSHAVSQSTKSYQQSHAAAWNDVQFQKCNFCNFVREKGILEFRPGSPRAGGQLIGSIPITDSTSFSLKILATGRLKAITIGVVPEEYSDESPPGWFRGSLGYHSDDGKLYHDSVRPAHGDGKHTCTTGDKMTCFVKKTNGCFTVSFLKNEVQVFQEELCLDENLWYPMIGLSSEGDNILLLNKEAWLQQLPKFNLERGCKYDLTSGILSYVDGAGRAGGQLIGRQQLERPMSFSIEITGKGHLGAITIGVAPFPYPEGFAPGWQRGSVGYHADDGGLHVGIPGETPSAPSKICNVGDRMKCTVQVIDADIISVTFYKNNKLIHELFLEKGPPLFPMVGLSSTGESAKLLNPEIWG